MEDRAHGRGYSRVPASRLARKPSKQQQQQNAAAKKKQSANGKRVVVGVTRRGVQFNNGSSGPRKSLVDAFKQHGMRLCDGTKLNAVGKAIQCIGSIPPVVSASISALFLSQNNLKSLDGVEQFVTLRLLSIGGNLLTQFSELERLTKLPGLRNLNLLGNPLCDHPNYRLRVVDCLAQLQVLDTADITAKERELAPCVASRDKTLRMMVLQNHFAIQKLRKIASLVQLRKDFYGFVMVNVGAATGGSNLSFDVLPNPHNAQVDVEKLLRLWRYESSLSVNELEALELQMVTIVVRTHHKLAEHPKLKAKEFLLKLAANRNGKEKANSSNVSTELRHECASWDEAFGNVLALQQQTLANLQSDCERSNRELVASLKTLLTTDPGRRKALVSAKWARRYEVPSRLSIVPGSPRAQAPCGVAPTSSGAGRDKQRLLPPQQQDPDQTDLSEHPCEPPHSRTQYSRQQQQIEEESERVGQVSRCTTQQYHRPMQNNQPPSQEGTPRRPTATRSAELRSGDFGVNQTLSNAAHRFTLREPSARHSVVASNSIGALQSKEKSPFMTNANFGHLKQPRVYTIQHDTQTDPLSHRNRAFAHATDTSLSKPKTNFYSVSSGSRAKEVDSADKRHDLAALMNQRDLSSSSNAYGASGRLISTMDDSMETASSVSSFSDVSSSLWRHSRCRASTSLQQQNHHHSHQRELHKVEALPSPPFAAQYHRHAHDQQSSLQAETFDTSSSHKPAHYSPPHQQEDGNLGDRHHELEEREEKYIKALIESEQRELDLRNQLNSFKKKFAQHQQTMAQELHEKQQIKQEMDEKVQALATPKVLKRFFINWIHYHYWSLQHSHFERKRAFILQHNWFWRWRHKVWTQQRLREIRQNKQRQVAKQLFATWVNASRLAVVATFAKNKHAKRRLATVFRAWRQGVKRVVTLKRVELSREQESIKHLQRRCFAQWMKLTRHRKQFKTAFSMHLRRSQRAMVELTFCRWKMVVVTEARPQRTKLTQFIQAKQTQRFKRHFFSWSNFVRGQRLYFTHLKRRVWTHWTKSFRFAKVERENALRSRRMVLKERFAGWHVATQDQVASRRSLGLAKRYVNQRRLRKLWFYWKCYTFAKRKYVQGSTKALKHYFVKLLRSSWIAWKKQTRRNLMCVKQKKHSDLQRHFQAFCVGIRLKIIEKCRARLLMHLRTRRNRSLARKLLILWREIVRRRRQTKQYCLALARQNRRNLVQGAWNQWMSSYLLRLRGKLNTAEQRCEDAIKETDSMETEVLRANDHTMALNQQISSLKGTIRAQEDEIATYQNDLLHSEQFRVDLEARMKALEDNHGQERQQWAVLQAQLSDQRVAEQEQTQSMADSTSKLQHQIQELQARLIEEQQHTLEMDLKHELSREEFNKVKQTHEAQVAQLNSAYEALKHHVVDLKHQLVEEQQQKEETANRLQEYEARLATTCQDINQHEEAHERENERLHLERHQVEAKVHEEQARNAVLQGLLEEKNALIHQLSQQLQQHVVQKNNSFSQYQEQKSPIHLGNGVVQTHQYDEESISAPRSHLQAQPDSYWMSCETPMAAIGTALHNKPKSTIGPLLKDINQSILVRTELMGEPRVHAADHSTASGVDRKEQCDGYRSVGESTRSRERQANIVLEATARVIEDSSHIDEHANKVHEDIRQLQERIAKRLRQTPADASSRSHRGFRLKSPCSSSTFLSEAEIDLAESEPSRPKWRGGEERRSSCAATAKMTKRALSQVGTMRAPQRAPSSSENVPRLANALPSKRPGAPRTHLSEPQRRHAASTLQPGPAAAIMKKRNVKAQLAASTSARTNSTRS